MISSLVRNAALAAVIVALFASGASADQITAIEDTGVALTISGQPICGGTVIGVDKAHELIATAGHCLVTEDGSADGVMFFNGDRGHIIDSVRDPNNDVAVIEVTSMRRHPAMRMDWHTLRRLTPVIVFGLPNGQMWTMSRGYILQGTSYPVSTDYPMTNPGETFYWPNAWEMDCSDCTSGSSGGGVFSKRGLVGIVVGHDVNGAGEPLTPNHEFVEPINDVISLLETVESAAR
jgi:hypothetical protein